MYVCMFVQYIACKKVKLNVNGVVFKTTHRYRNSHAIIMR